MIWRRRQTLNHEGFYGSGDWLMIRHVMIFAFSIVYRFLSYTITVYNIVLLRKKIQERGRLLPSIISNEPHDVALLRLQPYYT